MQCSHVCPDRPLNTASNANSLSILYLCSSQCWLEFCRLKGDMETHKKWDDVKSEVETLLEKIGQKMLAPKGKKNG